MAQRVEDPALSPLWLGSDSQPQDFCMPQDQLKKKKKIKDSQQQALYASFSVVASTLRTVSGTSIWQINETKKK